MLTTLSLCVYIQCFFVQSGARIFAKQSECGMLYFYNFSVFYNRLAHTCFYSSFFKQFAFREAFQTFIFLFLEATSLSAQTPVSTADVTVRRPWQYAQWAWTSLGTDPAEPGWACEKGELITWENAVWHGAQLSAWLMKGMRTVCWVGPLGRGWLGESLLCF